MKNQPTRHKKILRWLVMFAVASLLPGACVNNPSAAERTPPVSTPAPAQTASATAFATPSPTTQPVTAPDFPLVYSSDNQVYRYHFDTNMGQAVEPAAVFLSKGSSASYLTVSPDGSQLLFDGYDPQIGCPTFRDTAGCWLTGPNGFFLLDFATGGVELVAPFAITDIDWSPDGSSMVYSQLIFDTKLYQSKLMIKPAAGGESIQITDGTWVDEFPSWSPDGQWIAFLRVTPPSPGGPQCTHSLGFYDDCYDPSLYIIHPDGSGLTLLLRHARFIQTSYNQPSWSPDGKIIALIAGRNPAELTLVDVETKKAVVLPGFVPSADIPLWSPNGKMLAFTSQMNGSEQVIAISADGKLLKILSSSLERAAYPVWSPDGKWVAFLGGKLDEKRHLVLASMDGNVFSEYPLIQTGSRPVFLPESE